MATANEWAPDADVKLTRATMELFKGTSVTSNTVADTGSLTFTTQTYLYFAESKWLEIVDNANANNWMAGQVTSYNSLTGALVFAPKVKSGSGTIADWLIYSSGVWIANPWNGGTVTNPVTISNTLNVTGASTVARVNASAPITSTAGDVNLNTTTALADASQTLTAAQIFNGTLTISPTAARILTLPTAAAIIAYMPGYVVGSNFRFTLVNTTTQSVTIAAGAGITQLGKTLLTDGSAVFKVVIDSATVATVINESVFTPAAAASPAGVITSSQTRSSAVDLTLTATSPGLQLITMTAEGKYVILPDATTLSVASPSFVIYNKGYNIFGIKDGSGALIAAVEGGGEITLSLADKTTVAGVWTRTGTGLSRGYLEFSKSIVGYSADVTNAQPVYLNLTANMSIHFVNSAAGYTHVVLIDAVGKVVGTPTNVTSAFTGALPKALFKVDDSTAILFYSNVTNRLYASLLLVSSPLVVVTAPVDTGVLTGISMEEGNGAPKIAQLDTNLYLITYASNTLTTTVKGCQISGGSLITFGAAVDLAAVDGRLESPTVTALTTTTALALYKIGAASPYAGRARVVTVSNANPPVCTLGAEVTHLSSLDDEAISYDFLTPTLAVVIDVASGTTVNAAALTISGTSITVGTTVDTGLGVYPVYAKAGFSSRKTKHVTRITDSTALIWGKDGTSGFSALAMLSVASGVITPGSVVRKSFSSATGTGTGQGILGPLGGTEFLGLHTLGGPLAIPHKISGTTITVGRPMSFQGFGIGGTLDVQNVLITSLTNNMYVLLLGIYSLAIVRLDGSVLTLHGAVNSYYVDLVQTLSRQLPSSGDRINFFAREKPLTAASGIAVAAHSILVNSGA